MDTSLPAELQVESLFHSTPDAPLDKGLRQAHGDFLRLRLETVQEHVNDFRERVEAIEADSKLSDEGKAQQIDKQRRALRASADFEIKRGTDRLDMRIKSLEGEVAKQLEFENPFGPEIRAHFKSLEATKRLTALDDAARNLDLDVVQAVMSAPRMLSGLDHVDDATWDRVRGRAIHAVSPAASAELGTARLLRERLVKARAAVDRL